MKHVILPLLMAVNILHPKQGIAGPQSGRKLPKTVLVQLSSETNRINAISNAHQAKLLEEVTMDSKNAARAMINDFTDHFDYCPVYYFIDTNAEKVKMKNFTHVLLRADGSEVNDVNIAPGTGDYIIVYYGYPNEQNRRTGKGTDQPSSRPGRGLVILNSNYEQITYGYKLGWQEFYLKRKKKNKYAYESKHFDIQYMPMAAGLNENLKGNPTKQYKKQIRTGKP